MFLNAVVLILQELLEAMLLLGVLLALTRGFERQHGLQLGLRWVLASLALGGVGALAYGWALPTVSAWFDYLGYEIINALLQAGIVSCLFVLMHASGTRRGGRPSTFVLQACMSAVVALSIVREGSEIILYLQGIFGQPENVPPVLLGGLTAAGIGISSGLLLYLGLQALPGVWMTRVALLLLALFAGNMSAQAVLLLTQADWLPATRELWNTSGWLPEYSISGQLLYALIGYEANPSLLQVLAYSAACVLVAASPLFRAVWLPFRRGNAP